MSLVVAKNLVVNLTSKIMPNNSKKNNESKNETAPLLTEDNNTSPNSYGSSSGGGTTSNDLESNTNNNNDDIHYHHHDHQMNLMMKIFGKVDPRIISDLIIGLSDGLTVPFALTAGLSSLGDSKLVITGGFAELISGAISMGLGGYLGAKSESDYYKSEVKKQRKTFFNDMILVNHEIEDILLTINPNFSEETILSFMKDLQDDPDLMIDFIIRFGKGLDEPAENRQLISAVTIGGGYFFGGIVPLIPYFFVSSVGTGLIYSIIIMVITLFWFGVFKSQMSMGYDCPIRKQVSEGFQMIAVGGVAAGAAWYFVKLLG